MIFKLWAALVNFLVGLQWPTSMVDLLKGLAFHEHLFVNPSGLGFRVMGQLLVHVGL